jgi:hypothetical protein
MCELRCSGREGSSYSTSNQQVTGNMEKDGNGVSCKFITKKGALDSQPQVKKFTSCLPMVGGSLRVLRLLPPLKLIAMIELKCC